jgi:GT2 family glycosyltransferase
MAGSDPLVDVAVVTWNTRETTVNAIASLLAAEPAGTLRVLVRDNASSDGTAEAVAAAYPDVEVDAGDDNLGFAGGVNTILRRSKAPWCLLLNSDAWPEPGAISQLVECAERHPRAAAVTPRLLRPDGSPEVAAWPFPSVRATVRASRHAYNPLSEHETEHAVDWAIGAALLIRRAALQEIGELDESLFMYGEDLDWCWRARDAGWEIWLTPNAIVRHVGNASGVQRYGAQQAARWIPNSIVVYRRHNGVIATFVWQIVNAVGSLHAARRARRAGNQQQAQNLRLQAKAWTRPHRFKDHGD